jgi:hypothetical protein
MVVMDGAGYPVSYCLLSTADSLEIGKRTKALTAWAVHLRDTFGIHPDLVHLDKDMALIGMLRATWNLIKANLCYWHKRKAVRERLAKSKLSTSPYTPKKAHAEFNFINISWRPPGQPDKEEHEGGMRDDWKPNHAPAQPNPNAIHIRLPPPTQSAQPPTSTPSNPSNLLSSCPVSPDTVTGDVSNRVQMGPAAISALGTTIKLLPPRPPAAARPKETDLEVSESEAEDRNTRRTFCPPENRLPILDMMETHYCAHPLIPGYSHPSPAGIKYWAVKEMYEYCHSNDLREVWAYLWENWYREGRWEIWARSAHPEIPTVKTTMVMESQ